MRKISVVLVIILLFFAVGCSVENVYDVVEYIVEDNIEYISQDSSEYIYADESDDEEYIPFPSCCNAPALPIGQRAINDYFSPLNIATLHHGASLRESIPDTFKLYPFGEIMNPEIEGLASFIIYFGERFQAEQWHNMLRITPVGDYMPDNVPVFMEITQVSNITVQEIEYKILSTIDGNPSHLQPRANFPFVEVRHRDSGGSDSVVTSTYIRDNLHGGVFVIITQHSFGRGWAYGVDFVNSLKTFAIITEPELLPFSDEHDDLPVPKFIMTYMMGTPVMARYYPFVIAAYEQEVASYVIFIENCCDGELRDGLLRITPIWDRPAEWPEFYMEIKQVPNITISEMANEIISFLDFEDYYYIYYHLPNEYAPFAHFSLYDGFYHDSITRSVRIKDNEHGGVFVITTQHTIEGTEGIGIRFRNFLATLEVLD